MLGPMVPCQAFQGGVISDINFLAFLALFPRLLMLCSSHKSYPRLGSIGPGRRVREDPLLTAMAFLLLLRVGG